MEKKKWAWKPMNCPGHCLIFDSQDQSYKELPIHMAEFDCHMAVMDTPFFKTNIKEVSVLIWCRVVVGNTHLALGCGSEDQWGLCQGLMSDQTDTICKPDTISPLDKIAPHILRLWKTCQTDRNIVHILWEKHINTKCYGIGLTKFREIWEGMGLRWTCQQVSLYFTVYEPELVREHKARSFKRRHFWAAGMNDLFAVNQHDKWLRFGLGLHTGIKPFSGHVMWIRVWHSNGNPQLILSNYLDTIEELGRLFFISRETTAARLTLHHYRHAIDHSK
ncbi:hypothetical protein BDR05DRAFT_943312 [Suillus weaverae]|nr:hypothetical protein BDR05DRAFT_943312 [Suillus weaverae]